jgi:hypothetical protein
MHTSDTGPGSSERKEPDPSLSRAVVESTAQPNEARPLIIAAAPIAAEPLDLKGRLTPRLLDAMFHWVLSRS